MLQPVVPQVTPKVNKDLAKESSTESTLFDRCDGDTCRRRIVEFKKKVARFATIRKQLVDESSKKHAEQIK